MLRFYWRLLRGLPHEFRQAVETWQFWGTVILTTAVYVVPSIARLTQHPPHWLVIVPIVALLVWAALRANYRQFQALDSQVATLERSRDRQATLDMLGQLRAHGVLLFARPLKATTELPDWLSEEEGWRRVAAAYLESNFNRAERFRFENLGALPVGGFAHAATSQHDHALAMLSRRLEILDEIGKRYTLS